MCLRKEGTGWLLQHNHPRSARWPGAKYHRPNKGKTLLHRRRSTQLPSGYVEKNGAFAKAGEDVSCLDHAPCLYMFVVTGWKVARYLP